VLNGTGMSDAKRCGWPLANIPKDEPAVISASRGVILLAQTRLRYDPVSGSAISFWTPA
jgi:hypothetical protein